LYDPEVLWDNSTDGSRPAPRPGRCGGAPVLALAALRVVRALRPQPGDHVRRRGSGARSLELRRPRRHGRRRLRGRGYYEDEYVCTAEGRRFRLHREVPFFFVKTGESWAGPKLRIMSEWMRRA